MSRVEVDVSSGLPHISMVGLPDGAEREASDRIRAAAIRGPSRPSARRALAGEVYIDRQR